MHLHQSATQPPYDKPRGPGFTTIDLDEVCRRHYGNGYAEGRQDESDEATARLVHERDLAARCASVRAESDLLKWMYPNVMHKVLTSAERIADMIDDPKLAATTRERLEPVLHLLKQSQHTFHSKRPRDV